MNQNQIYVLKLKSAGLTDKAICQRLSISQDGLDDMWNSIQSELQAKEANSYYALSERFTMLCHQYNLLGDSLKVIGFALNSFMLEEELRTLITTNVEETLSNLRMKALVLRPYVPPIESPPPPMPNPEASILEPGKN